MGHNSDSVELQYCNIDGSEQRSAVAGVPPTAAADSQRRFLLYDGYGGTSCTNKSIDFASMMLEHNGIHEYI